MTKEATDNNETKQEKAVLIGLVDTSRPVIENEAERSIEELALLAKTAGALVVGSAIQRKSGIDHTTFIGKGKLMEIASACEELDAEMLVFDDELSGSQLRNIEEMTGLKVVDRTLLILDIFAQRAQSKEGKLQVELAQQKYRYSRLIGFGKSLSRLGGGIGTRGPGESKLETDRRHIKRRIDFLKATLAEVGERRDRIREKRRDSDVVTIAVVGYTNAGKSTLINRLCTSDLFARDMLFATLDSAARKLVLPDGLEAILVDTVGFIRKLPHHLVEAFKSTLEELVVADIILHVVDSADEDLARHMEIVEDLLTELNAAGKPRITVFNKIDLAQKTGSVNTVFRINNVDNIAQNTKDLYAEEQNKKKENVLAMNESSEIKEIIHIVHESSERYEQNNEKSADCMNGEFKLDENTDAADGNPVSGNSKDCLDGAYKALDNATIADSNNETANSTDGGICNQSANPDTRAIKETIHATLSERFYEGSNPSFNIRDGIVLQVSAVTGDGIDALLEVVRQQVQKAKTQITILLPYKDAGVLDFIRKNGSVGDVEYLDNGIKARIRIPPSKLSYIKEYMI